MHKELAPVKEQVPIIIKFMNKNGRHLIKDVDYCFCRTHENCSNSVQSIATVDSCYCQRNIRETAKSMWKSENFINWYKPAQLLHPEFITPWDSCEKHLDCHVALLMYFKCAWFKTQRHETNTPLWILEGLLLDLSTSRVIYYI